MKIGTFLSPPDSINVPGAPGVGGVPQTSAADFGAGVGAATQAAGAALIKSGEVLGDINRKLDADAKEERNKTIAADTASWTSKFDFSSDNIAIQTAAGARPEDLPTAVGNAYDVKRDAFLDTIKDNDVRRQVKIHLDAGRERYVQQAAGFQAKSQADASVRDANDGINVQTNSVFKDPSLQNFEIASKNIDNIINTRQNVTGDIKETMRQQAQWMLARRRFEAMIGSTALDPQALEGVQKELNSPEWRSKVDDKDFAQLNEQITTLTKAANSQEVALARSSLATLKLRNNDPSVLIPDDEMNAIKATVVKTGQHSLMSEYAGYAQTQAIYKQFQGLPLDQMRTKIEEMRKRGGVSTLPKEIQDGINEASALTNGKVPTTFLAGTINVEYPAAALARGDYGIVTGNKNPDGNAGSDAAGITQFIGSTWRETLRKHASELGIDPSKSDAELDVMRKYPKLMLKATALHAQDNGNILRSALGREPSDSDLYFAHFLGAGGAVRYLQGAQANPNAPALNFVDPDQVKANRPVFYNEAGNPRTVTQVNTYISDKMMNGPSRIGEIGVKAGERYLGHVSGELRDDPISYGQATGRFGTMGDMSTSEGIAQRGVAAANMASMYGIPLSQFKPLSKSEVETMGTQIRDGDANATMDVLTKTAQLGNPAIIAAANKQLGEKDPTYGFAADVVVARPDMKSVAMDVIRGQKRIKADPEVKKFIDAQDNAVERTFNSEIGKALVGESQSFIASVRNAATAYYIEHSISRGGVQPNTFNDAEFREAIRAVVGSDVATINGAKMILPPKVSEATFNTALRRMTLDDYTALSTMGGVPRYRDGRIAAPDEIARSGQFESVGKGNYRIKLADGQYAITAAYTDDSTDLYIFHGDPARLTEVAARQPNIAPLPPVVPGVQPARPRSGPGRSGRKFGGSGGSEAPDWETGKVVDNPGSPYKGSHPDPSLEYEQAGQYEGDMPSDGSWSHATQTPGRTVFWKPKKPNS